MRRTCEWTGTDVEGPALLIPTTEGREVVDPAALRELPEAVAGLRRVVRQLRAEVAEVRERLDAAEADPGPEPSPEAEAGPEPKRAARKTAGKGDGSDG